MVDLLTTTPEYEPGSWHRVWQNPCLSLLRERHWPEHTHTHYSLSISPPLWKRVPAFKGSECIVAAQCRRKPAKPLSVCLWHMLTHVLNWISVKPIIYHLFLACYHKFYLDFPSPLLAYNPLAKPARVPLTQLIPFSHTHTHIHTFTIVSLLLALMADLCLPLSAGEDTFELHSVQLELEAVERWIHEQLGKQDQLRKWKATLETSRADAHKSGVSMQRATSTPCVSLHAIIPDGLHSGAGKPRTLGAAVEDAIQAPVDEFSPSGLRHLIPEPLRSSLRDWTWRCGHRRLNHPARPCYVSWR